MRVGYLQNKVKAPAVLLFHALPLRLFVVLIECLFDFVTLNTLTA